MPARTKIEAKAREASEYMKQLGFKVGQVNGQRISTNSSVKFPPTDVESTEIFIGKIPRDLFEDELYPHIAKIGKIYKIRLMVDFSGFNRGYAYVQFEKPSHAKAACRQLKTVWLRHGSPPSGVMASFDNKRLFIGNLPAEVTLQRLSIDLSKLLEGIAKIELGEPIDGERRNAYVTFQKHKNATDARRLLLPGTVTYGGNRLTVDWAKPESVTPIPSIAFWISPFSWSSSLLCS